jgi:hypothetical protein
MRLTIVNLVISGAVKRREAFGDIFARKHARMEAAENEPRVSGKPRCSRGLDKIREVKAAL